MRIGIVTAGGDCPGLNAVIRAVVRRGVMHHGMEFLGYCEGWRGLVEGIRKPLDLPAVEHILTRGGTILRTSRLDIRKVADGYTLCADMLRRDGVDGLIAIGGNGTQAANLVLSQLGINCIGVPKTIDNDLNGTDACFGFDTAVGIATEAIGRLHTTAEAHNRVFVCEVMGRHAGWIAAYAGIAGGAHSIVVPELPITMDEIARQVRYQWRRGDRYAIVAVAEGVRIPGLPAPPEGQLFGIAHIMAEELQRVTGYDTRSVVLGHVLRGGEPSATDRVLATRFGVAAADLAAQEKFGRMTALRGTRVVDIPLREAVAQARLVSPEILTTLMSMRPLEEDAHEDQRYRPEPPDDENSF